MLYDSTMGYVMRSFLTFEQDVSPSPDVKYAIVTTPSGTLNLRAVPSRNAQVLRTIAPSTRLAVLEHGAAWCKVQHEGITGYVMTQFLVFEADATATPTPTEIFPTLSPAPTLAPTPHSHIWHGRTHGLRIAHRDPRGFRHAHTLCGSLQGCTPATVI